MRPRTQITIPEPKRTEFENFDEHEERARQTKCKQVATHVIQTAANALQGFNDEEWQNLAAQAGTRMPSEISRATIIAMLRDIK